MVQNEHERHPPNEVVRHASVKPFRPGLFGQHAVDESDGTEELPQEPDEDDGPVPDTTVPLLDLLDEEGVIRWNYLSPVGINPGADGILEALNEMSKN